MNYYPFPTIEGLFKTMLEPIILLNTERKGWEPKREAKKNFQFIVLERPRIPKILAYWKKRLSLHIFWHQTSTRKYFAKALLKYSFFILITYPYSLFGN